MLQAVTLAGVHSDVGRAPVRVVPQAIDYRLKRLWFERRTESFVEGAELEGVLREPVRSVLLQRHLEQPEVSAGGGEACNELKGWLNGIIASLYSFMGAHTHNALHLTYFTQH